MTKLSEASVQLAKARPRALPPPTCPLSPDWTTPHYRGDRRKNFTEYRECKRCQGAPCGYCDELHPITED
jgi:hypothetical protein